MHILILGFGNLREPLLSNLMFTLMFLVQLTGAQVPETERTAIVLRQWGNVRTRPTTSSSIIRRAYEGEELEVIEERNAWVKVSLEGEGAGWIFGDLVRIVVAEGEVEDPETAFPFWMYLPGLFIVGLLCSGVVYFWLSRKQRTIDYAGRLDRMTSAGYIETASRDDVIRLTRAFGLPDRTARGVARQTYLDRYVVSSSHRRLTEKEKGSFRKLQSVLQLSDEEVMRIMAKAYKGKRSETRSEK